MNDVKFRAHRYIVQWINSLESKPQLDINADCNLVDDGLIDSLAFIRLIVSIESEFSIELDLAEMDPQQFTTISGLVEAIHLALSSTPNGNNRG